MNLKDVLKSYKEKTGCSNDYIAEKVGVNKSTVSRWLKGDVKIMKQSVVENLSYLLGTDVETLIKNAEKFEKPILGVAKAGYGLLAEEYYDGYLSVSKDDYYKGDYFLRITGDSMIGAKIHDNDLIYVKQCNDVPSGTIAVILIGGEEATVKKVIKKNNMLILETANPAVENRYFSIEEVKNLPVIIIGKVLYSRSDFE
jgi:repressor LexA